MVSIIETMKGVFDNFLFDVFLGLTVLDIITGYGKAIVAKKYNSSVDTAGWVKRATMLMVLIILFPLVNMGELANVYNLFAVGFIITSAGSNLENLVVLGVPVPQSIEKFIDDEKKKL